MPQKIGRAKKSRLAALAGRLTRLFVCNVPRKNGVRSQSVSQARRSFVTLTFCRSRNLRLKLHEPARWTLVAACFCSADPREARDSRRSSKARSHRGNAGPRPRDARPRRPRRAGGRGNWPAGPGAGWVGFFSGPGGCVTHRHWGGAGRQLHRHLRRTRGGGQVGRCRSR